MPRIFGKIGASLDKSEKWWSLPSDGDRLAYTWLHWCRYGSPIGIFHLPPVMMADGLRWEVEAAERSLAAMEAAGLIQRADGHVVRITSWFRQHNGPRNPSAAIGVLKQFRSRVMIPDSLARSCAVLELLHVTYSAIQAATWDRNTQTFAQLLEVVEGVAADEWRRAPELTQEAMTWLGLELGDRGWSSLWDSVSARAGQPVRTLQPRERGRER